MKKNEAVDTLLSLLLTWLVLRLLEPVGHAEVGPVSPVGGIGNTISPAMKDLCEGAPWQSFGPGCQGYTWDLDQAGRRQELRTRVATGPNQDVFS